MSSKAEAPANSERTSMTHVTIEREALQTVLEALESCDQVYGSEGSYQYFSQVMVDKAITVAKQALAQPAPVQPVTQWRNAAIAAYPNSDPDQWPDSFKVRFMEQEIAQLRATPPAEPVPLTDEEAHNVGERAEELLGHGHGAWDTRPLHEIVHAVLTAAKEMNGITASPKKGQP
jgi:hypothetical protein